MNEAPPPLGVIACQVFADELALLGLNAPHIRAVEFFEIGLHDRSATLRESLAEAVQRLDQREDLQAIVLVYGLCGCGTAGLRAGRLPLVIPSAHDCMTLFLGSRAAYTARQARAPDTFYFTPGWMQAGRSPGPRRLQVLREEYAQRFDAEDVEFLLQTEEEQWRRHRHAVFLHLGTPASPAAEAEAAATAASLGWQLERPACDPSLLRDLLRGDWDADRFQIVPPGGLLQHQPDEQIFRAITAEGDFPQSDPQKTDPR